jgi:hydrogenase/urease accessory protein HupE
MIRNASARTIEIGSAATVWIWLSAIAAAHPLVENSFDVIANREQVRIEARIAAEEIAVVDNGGNGPSPNPRWQAAMQQHADYVRRHVHVLADGQEIEGRAELASAADNSHEDESENGPLIRYRLTYPLAAPPREIVIRQDFLREFSGWDAPCVVRMRQSDRSEFGMSLLERNETATLRCEWTANSSVGVQSEGDSGAANATIRTDVPFWPTFRAYAAHGIEHILTGYDHLLFVTALVLAAGRLWDLVKIVTAFTLAHTLTLGLSVFNIVTLRSSIVEPMIALSIVFVAVQNVFWPERSTGRLRLAIAFGFGLFHGLGFAGGLKDAMSEMPSVAMWVALVAFSLGVEIGHQMVVLPLYSALAFARSRERGASPGMFSRQILRFGSLAIMIAGMYYLIESLR